MVELKLFGTPQAIIGKRSATLPLEKSAALLFYVAAHPNGVSRSNLATLFWSDTDDGRSRANLRQLLTRVRRQEWSSALEISEDFLFWRGESDLAAFWKNLSNLELEQYAAEFLEGFLVADSPEFMDWLELERQTIRNAWREAGLNKAKSLEPQAALTVLRQILRFEPLCEEAVQGFLRICAVLGQPEIGRSCFIGFANALKAELGLEPLPETQELLSQLNLPESSTKITTPTTIPAAPTPFFGRELELATLEKRLESGARCMSLVAAGGMGKTRLALRVATDWQDSFTGGVVFVSALGLQGEAALADAILGAFGNTSRQADPKSALLKFLETRHCFLVLDNLESDLASASSLIASILEHCTQVFILTTSRERLGISSEEVFEVGHLSPQTAETLFIAAARRADARLYIDQSQLVIVQRIAKHCGYMPLALELAASWAAVLSLSDLENEVLSSLNELESRFSDTPARHKSIRAVFEQTWIRLEPRLRQILGLLSPLEGGFSLAMAKGIASATLRDIEALIARSLLSRNVKRYSIHELLRQFVSEQPQADIKPALDWISSAIVHDQASARRTPKTLANFEEDMVNIRNMVYLLLEQKNYSAAAVLITALDDVYDTRGLSLEAKQVYARVRASIPKNEQLYAELLKNEAHYTMRLGATEEAETLFLEALRLEPKPSLQAAILLYLGQLTTRTGRWQESEAHYLACLELFRQLKDPVREAESLNGLGVNAKMRGDFEAAKTHLEQAIWLHQNHQNLEGNAIATLNLANVFEATGQDQAALSAYQKCLSHFIELGHKRAIAVVLNNLSIVQRKLGDLENAHISLQESLRLKREMHDKRGIAVALQSLAELSMQQNNASSARTHLLESIQIALEASAMPTVMQSFHALAGALELEGNFEQAALVWRAVAAHPATSGEIRANIAQKALPSGRTPEFQELLQSVVD